jgi:membrane-associated phospholipid phosphatase
MTTRASGHRVDATEHAEAASSRREGSRHGPVAQLLIAWSPLSAILVLYALAQWINAPISDGGDLGGSNRLGFRLHIAGPARVDETVFGVLPSEWLQRRLVDGATHWYDAVAALVYVTHFVSIPVVTALVWFRMRDRFSAWIAGVLAFTLVGVLGYVLYPAAPPWLASDQGAVGAVDRISRYGWHYLQLDPIARVSALGQGDSNPVAAMPSLHAGAALLVAGFLWPAVNAWWRALLATYVVLMALTLVYTGEHYAVDAVAGWLTASVGLAVSAATYRRARRLSPPQRTKESSPS